MNEHHTPKPGDYNRNNEPNTGGKRPEIDIYREFELCESGEVKLGTCPGVEEC